MVNSKVSITAPTASDFSPIFSLLKELWPNDKLQKAKIRKVFTRGLKSGNQIYLIAKRNGNIVGFAEVLVTNDFKNQSYSASLQELVVSSKHAGQGIGKKLLDQAINVARSKSCGTISVSSASFRKAAHALYERYGFKKYDGYLFLKKLA